MLQNPDSVLGNTDYTDSVLKVLHLCKTPNLFLAFMGKQASLLRCQLDRRMPLPFRVVAVNIGHGEFTRVMIVPWAGLALANVSRIKRLNSDQKKTFEQYLKVRLDRSTIHSVSRLHLGIMRINPVEMRHVLLRYKRRECVFESFLDEMIIYHGETTILLHFSLGVVHIIGDSWDVFRSHIFLNGVLAMMASI